MKTLYSKRARMVISLVLALMLMMTCTVALAKGGNPSGGWNPGGWNPGGWNPGGWNPGGWNPGGDWDWPHDEEEEIEAITHTRPRVEVEEEITVIEIPLAVPKTGAPSTVLMGLYLVLAAIALAGTVIAVRSRVLSSKN